jgi:DNA-binding transcriptional LysR family regulator
MVRNTTSLLALVRAGAGLTVLPHLAVISAPPGLGFLPVENDAVHRRIHVLRNVRLSLAPAAQAFEKAVRRAARTIALRALPLSEFEDPDLDQA